MQEQDNSEIKFNIKTLKSDIEEKACEEFFFNLRKETVPTKEIKLAVEEKSTEETLKEVGIEGLDAQHNKEVLIGQSSAELVELSEKLLEDEELYKTIQGNARELIEKKYSWDKIVKKLEDIYQTVV